MNKQTFMNNLNLKNTQSGMTMIEILVTILITAVGLLGIASLQTTTMKSSLESAQRTAAAGLANEIVDRLRANPTGKLANSYSAAFAANGLCDAEPANMCADYYDQDADAVATSGTCTAAQMATFDAWEISCGYENLANTFSSPVNYLVSPTFTVQCTDSNTTDTDNCSDNSTHTITVSWSAVAPTFASKQDAPAEGESLPDNSIQTHTLTINPIL